MTWWPWACNVICMTMMAPPCSFKQPKQCVQTHWYMYNPPTYFKPLSHRGGTPLSGGWMLGDTPLCSDAPKLFPTLSESILILTLLLYYKYPQMDCYQPSQKPTRSNSKLDPSKPFFLVTHLSLYFTFSSCFIFKLCATYIVWLYPSRDSSFSFRIPC